MKLYSAFIKKNQDNKIEDVVLLDEGFCFWAFLFGGFWFVFHKIWFDAIFIFAVNILLQILTDINFLPKIIAGFLGFSFLIIIAYNANSRLAKSLLSCNYKLAGFALANNKLEAKTKFAQNLYKDYNLNIDEFSDAIVDSKGYRKRFLAQKYEPYF